MGPVQRPALATSRPGDLEPPRVEKVEDFIVKMPVLFPVSSYLLLTAGLTALGDRANPVKE
jgi:hypothetical protein